MTFRETGLRYRGLTLASLVVAMAVFFVVAIGSMQLLKMGRNLFSKSSWKQARLMELQDSVRRIREDLENASNEYESVKEIVMSTFEIKKLDLTPRPFHFREGKISSTKDSQVLFTFSVCQLKTMEVVDDSGNDDYNEGSRIDVRSYLENGVLYYERTRFNPDGSASILLKARPICRDVESIAISTSPFAEDPDNKTLVELEINVVNPRDTSDRKSRLREDTSVIINVEAIPDL